MLKYCPGSLRGTPSLETKICPVCGGEIDIFSIETHAACEKCGFIAYNDTQNCLNWCKYAKDCVGEEIYTRFMNRPRQEAV
jgi:hypothetical protein